MPSNLILFLGKNLSTVIGLQTRCSLLNSSFIQKLTETDYRQAIKITVYYQINEVGYREDIYELRYSDVRRYYYEENFNTFETLVKSFRLR